jgi:hypothetical protein
VIDLVVAWRASASARRGDAEERVPALVVGAEDERVVAVPGEVADPSSKPSRLVK